ncbi:MAG: hypothetical protein A4E30_00284 [Methanomassiliicoccales archaeon PtaB.Bin215]|nr:MAG: hypothetical protein A4E30_00284 [Methanomassiliicoccales archaeon PtaB.Bin215]
MTADVEPQPLDAKDEENRVLEFIATCPEGASYFTVTTELGIARTRAVSILERLHRDGRLSYDCKTKMYYPRPEKRPDLAPSVTVVPESKTCQYCGNNVEKYLWQHEQFCKENPNARKPGQKAKKKEELAEPTGFETLTEPAPEPVPINDIVPPLSADQKVAVVMLAAEAERQAMEQPLKEIEPTLDGWQQFVKDGPPLVEDSRGILNPAPDSLALFAQQHRVRVGREISKLKRVERKLRRRATSLETMAERVAAARQIKERELRKFERELMEARP